MARFFMESSRRIDEDKTIIFGDARISVITDRIIRVERAVNGLFEDRPTQVVLERNFAKPDFSYEKIDDKVLVLTKERKFLIDTSTLNVSVERQGKWVSEKNGTNLKGTARTLDFSWGKWQLPSIRVDMGKGLFSTIGVTEFDDSKSFILLEDGSVEMRAEGAFDKYIFAFGDDYLGGLKEFYALTGSTPVLPKYALGNWWSRYHAYTQEEYISLMDKFSEKDIPLSVATVDMDWHLVKEVPKEARGLPHSFQGPGWTGYTFNKKLFPDYKQFFKDLKARGLAVTMNLHPKDGVRFFEEQYPEMARANGIDPDTKKTVEFDFTDMRFVESYFDILHHPYENDGVDFWWIDWQQGKKSKLKGFDPLWALNHYHTLDSGREGRTPLILSRYAGFGSHRYPLGFSGDTFVKWSSLKLQPYFTATASNIGYSWWSHDIGGHIFSSGDSELYTRWVQYGVFSPINRLHSNNTSMSKEPWLYGDEAEKIVSEFMRLRHRLLPYLYTANIRTAKDGEPLTMPMYYLDKTKRAYKAKNQYYFGSELLVAPVVKRCSLEGPANVYVYLPNGKWTDFFTGEEYEGGKTYSMEIPLNRMPVFAREGAIIPMLAEGKGNSTVFDELVVRVYPGDNKYRMFDEGGYTDFEVKNTDAGYMVSVDDSNAPVRAKITIEFMGKEPQTIALSEGQKEVFFGA